MIGANGLTKRYGIETVFEGLGFQIGRGERVALLGVNGAGKTTLFRCLLGLTGFDGELIVDGLRVRPDNPEVRARLAYVPQLPPVYDLRLAEFVALFAGLRGIPVERVQKRLDELGLSLEGAGRQPLRDLSGGMLQKAYLALALAARARVVLLDEPTASLDPASRREFLRHLVAIEPGTTVILASHRLEEIEPLAERILVLDAGRLLFDGSLSALWAMVDAEAGLWIDIPEGRRPEAAEVLRRHPAVREAKPNGIGVQIAVAGFAYLDVLLHLQRHEVPVREFRTRPPALEDVMERLVGFNGDRGEGRSR
jgi:ABC-type multidrug transport system ATPase subunit